MRTAKTLIRLGGCPGWSGSSLGAHSFCWFCHVAAHLALQLVYCFTRFSFKIIDNNNSPIETTSLTFSILFVGVEGILYYYKPRYTCNTLGRSNQYVSRIYKLYQNCRSVYDCIHCKTKIQKNIHPKYNGRNIAGYQMTYFYGSAQ